MIQIYHATNTRGIRPIWLCEELGVDYSITRIDFSQAYRRKPEWRAMNPVGKVPVLEDGNLRMFESGAMVQFILARYGRGRLQPAAQSDAYAHYLQWMWFAEATLSRPLGEIVNHRREFPGELEIPAVVAEMGNRAGECLVAVGDAVVDKQFICGDKFTAADIMLGYGIHLAEMLVPGKIPDNLHPYWLRLKQRPGLQIAINA
ncbi:MAG: glutathione S-transferase family protein [bacterium]